MVCAITLAWPLAFEGKFWDFLPGGPLVKAGNYGQLDGACVFGFQGLVELPDGSFATYYSGLLLPHKYPEGLDERAIPGCAIWPKGRIIALEAEQRGRFVTLPIPMVGKRLRINALTERAGFVKVEVLQHRLEADMLKEIPPVEGRTLDRCDPIVGDCFRQDVTWALQKPRETQGQTTG